MEMTLIINLMAMAPHWFKVPGHMPTLPRAINCHYAKHWFGKVSVLHHRNFSRWRWSQLVMQTCKLLSQCSEYTLLIYRSWCFFTNQFLFQPTSHTAPSLEEVFSGIHSCTGLPVPAGIIWLAIIPVPGNNHRLVYIHLQSALSYLMLC